MSSYPSHDRVGDQLKTEKLRIKRPLNHAHKNQPSAPINQPLICIVHKVHKDWLILRVLVKKKAHKKVGESPPPKKSRTDRGKCTHRCETYSHQETTAHRRFQQKVPSSGARRQTDNKRIRQQRREQADVKEC